MKAPTVRTHFRASVVFALGILGICIAAASASAQENRPWYVAGHAGAALAQNADFDSPQALGTGQSVDIRGDITFNTAWGAGFAAGRSFGDFRVEGEGLWRRAGLRDVEISHQMGSPVAGAQETRLESALDVSGNMDLWMGMLNIYYDVPAAKAFRPYLGAGAGTVHAFMNKKASIGNRLRDGRVVEFATDDRDEDRWGFCWQAQAGAGFGLSESLTVQLGYRFVHAPSLKFRLFENLVESPTTVKVKPLHSFDLGLRLNF